MQKKTLFVIPEVHAASDAAAASIRVPFVRPALPSYADLQPAFENILRSGRLTKGPYVEQI